MSSRVEDVYFITLRTVLTITSTSNLPQRQERAGMKWCSPRGWVGGRGAHVARSLMKSWAGFTELYIYIYIHEPELIRRNRLYPCVVVAPAVGRSKLLIPLHHAAAAAAASVACTVRIARVHGLYAANETRRITSTSTLATALRNTDIVSGFANFNTGKPFPLMTPLLEMLEYS